MTIGSDFSWAQIICYSFRWVQINFEILITYAGRGTLLIFWFVVSYSSLAGKSLLQVFLEKCTGACHLENLNINAHFVLLCL